MQFTVPPADKGVKARRLALTGIDPDQKGGFATLGHRLHPGDQVQAPTGALILCVDKTTLDHTTSYNTGARVPIQDATVTVHLVNETGLTQLWQRHFKTAKSAYGAAVLNKLTTLLATHPAPDQEPEVIEEVQRTNRKPGTCRWCSHTVAARAGHVVDAQAVEHWHQCPTRLSVGGPCARCGEHTSQADAEVVLARQGRGWWQTLHRSECAPRPDLPDLRVSAHGPELSAEQCRRQSNAITRPCHWCGQDIGPEQGWLAGFGEQVRYEHTRCPDRMVPTGAHCALCGVDMVPGQGRMAPHRSQGQGGLRPEHDPLMCCTLIDAPSAAVVAAEREQGRLRARERVARDQAEKAEEEAKKEARRAKARARRQAKKEALAAEDRRLSAQGQEVSRTSKIIRSKKVDGQSTAYVHEHTLTLDNGHLTRRWQTVVHSTANGFNGEDYDPDPGFRGTETEDKERALEEYGALGSERYRTRGGFVSRLKVGAVPCPPKGAEHCDHCGISEHDGGGWMMASLGRACGVDCYDAMSNDRGNHAVLYHPRR